jgi:hypothetical protein
MPMTGIRTTLGCGAIACIVFALWLMLAADLSLESVGSAIIVAVAAANWARLIDD